MTRSPRKKDEDVEKELILARGTAFWNRLFMISIHGAHKADNI